MFNRIIRSFHKATRLISTAHGETGSLVIHTVTKSDKDSAVTLIQQTALPSINMASRARQRPVHMLSVIVSYVIFSYSLSDQKGAHSTRDYGSQKITMIKY